MLISKDTPEGEYEIRSYEPGKLVINEELYTHSVIVTTTSVTEWGPQSFSDLTLPHIETLLTFPAEIIVLGTGAHFYFPPLNLLAPLINHKVGYEIMDTSAACRTFNVLMSEGRKAIAALIIC